MGRHIKGLHVGQGHGDVTGRPVDVIIGNQDGEYTGQEVEQKGQGWNRPEPSEVFPDQGQGKARI